MVQHPAEPTCALKTALHRVRVLLGNLWPGAGHELIVHRDGGYRWNRDFPTVVDINEFERLRQVITEQEDEALDSYMEALTLYRGEFLNRLSSQAWVLPLSAYFHNQASSFRKSSPC